MGFSSRILTTILIAASLGAVLSPTATAGATASAALGNQSAGATLFDDGGLYRLNANTLVVTIIHLGPLDYVLELTEKTLDSLQTEGMLCAYGSADQPRYALACYCLNLDWSCQDQVATDWTCWASAGPTTEHQVGLVCAPPRTVKPTA